VEVEVEVVAVHQIQELQEALADLAVVDLLMALAEQVLVVPQVDLETYQQHSHLKEILEVQDTFNLMVTEQRQLVAVVVALVLMDQLLHSVVLVLGVLEQHQQFQEPQYSMVVVVVDHLIPILQ